LSASLLRFYWFRLSDAILPVGLVLAIGSYYVEFRRGRPERAAWFVALSATATLIVLSNSVRLFARDPRPQALRQDARTTTDSVEESTKISRDWIEACDWIRRHTRPTDVFFTPLDQQTFKWYAQRGELVSWKDVPQNATDICQWWKRKRAAWARNSPSTLCDLRVLAGEYGFQWVVLESTRVRRLGLPVQFSNSSYGVCRIERVPLPHVTPSRWPP
jgi:hypothetical protein